MKKSYYAVLLGFLFVSVNFCAVGFAENQQLEQGKIILGGGDGSSKNQPLIIKYTGNYNQSIGQEVQWLKEHFGAQDSSWSLVDKDTVKYSPSGRIHDIITIKVLASGEQKVFHFDITDPFLKLSQKITNG